MSDLDLDERIASLRLDLQMYGDEILSIIQSQYASTIPMPPLHVMISGNQISMDMKSNPKNALFILRKDLSEMIRDKLAEMKDVHEANTSSLSDGLQDCDEQLKILELIVKICDSFLNIDILMCESNLSALTTAILEVQSNIDKLPKANEVFSKFESISNGYVFKLLRSEFGQVSRRYQARLRRLLNTCVAVSHGKIVVTKKLSGVVPNEENIINDPINLEDIWMSLISMGLAEDCVNDLIRNVWNQIYKPLLKEKKTPAVKVLNSQDQSELILELSRQSEAQQSESDAVNSSFFVGKSGSGNSKVSVLNMLELLSTLLNFLWDESFQKLVALTPNIRKAFSQPSQSLVRGIYDIVLHSIPKLESELFNYRKSMEKPLKELETRMTGYGIIPSESSDESLDSSDSRYQGISSRQPISFLLEHLQNSFLDMRRKDIIGRAREYLTADYHNIMMASGDALEDEVASAGNIGDSAAMLEQSGSYAMQALQFDPCQISIASCRLLKLVHETLKQVAEASPDVAMVLLQSCRDSIELFLFIIPVKYSDILSRMPRMGAIFYNDCSYISHNTTLMTHIYREQIEKQKLTSSFIDFFPRLRSIGEQVLSRHIDDAKDKIAQFVVTANINPNSDSEDDSGGKLSRIRAAAINGIKKSSVPVNNEQVVPQIISYFVGLRDQWIDVMQEGTYQRIMGHLLESMLRLFMEPLLSSACNCITEMAAADISRLFRSLQKLRYDVNIDLSLQYDKR